MAERNLRRRSSQQTIKRGGALDDFSSCHRAGGCGASKDVSSVMSRGIISQRPFNEARNCLRFVMNHLLLPKWEKLLLIAIDNLDEEYYRQYASLLLIWTIVYIVEHQHFNFRQIKLFGCITNFSAPRSDSVYWIIAGAREFYLLDSRIKRYND